MRWMNPESIIHSEVSQKEKNKYRILMHIYGFCKNGTDYFKRYIFILDSACIESNISYLNHQVDIENWIVIVLILLKHL